MFLDDFLGLGESTLFGNDEIDMSQYKAIPLAEGENPVDACLRITIENEQNWSNIMNTIAISELAYMEENNTDDVVYEAVDIKKIGSTIMEWIKTQWEKLKGVFSRAVQTLKNTVVSDKSLCKQYQEKGRFLTSNESAITIEKGVLLRKNVSMNSLTNLPEEFKTKFETALGDYLTWTDLSTASSFEKGSAKRDALKSTWNQDKSGCLIEAMSAITGKPHCTKKEFSSALKQKLCNIGRVQIDADDAYNELKDGRTANDQIKKAFKSTENVFKGYLSDAKTFKKDHKSDDNGKDIAIMMGIRSEIIKTGISMINLECRVILQIVNAHYNTCKTAVSIALSKSKKGSKETNKKDNKKTTTSESALICDII